MCSSFLKNSKADLVFANYVTFNFHVVCTFCRNTHSRLRDKQITEGSSVEKPGTRNVEISNMKKETYKKYFQVWDEEGKAKQKCRRKQVTEARITIHQIVSVPPTSQTGIVIFATPSYDTVKSAISVWISIDVNVVATAVVPPLPFPSIAAGLDDQWYLLPPTCLQCLQLQPGPKSAVASRPVCGLPYSFSFFYVLQQYGPANKKHLIWAS